MSCSKVFKKCCILLSGDPFFTFTNSVDPDEMQHYAAFHLGLYCLQKFSFRGFPKTKGYDHLQDGGHIVSMSVPNHSRLN